MALSPSSCDYSLTVFLFPYFYLLQKKGKEKKIGIGLLSAPLKRKGCGKIAANLESVLTYPYNKL